MLGTGSCSPAVEENPRGSGQRPVGYKDDGVDALAVLVRQRLLHVPVQKEGWEDPQRPLGCSPIPCKTPSPRSLQHQCQQLHHLHGHAELLVEHHGHHACLVKDTSVSPYRGWGRHPRDPPHGGPLTLKRLVKSSMWAAVSRWP